MKFLCVECDEAMRLEGTSGPDRGSMTVIFVCPSCERKTAMLTNTMETQVVRSLGVKIGGRTAMSEPMQMVRGSLLGSRYDGAPSATSDSGPPRSQAGSPGEVPASHPDSDDPVEEASKCPFTGMVNEAFAQKEPLRWTEGARLRMEKIPEFARRMVMKGVEDAAKASGLDEVTETVLDDVRGQFGM